MNKNRAFDYLLAIVVASAGFIAYDQWSYDDRVPVPRWIGTEALNSPIRAGESLRVAITRDKVRDDCPVASSRQAIDADGRPFDLPDSVHVGGSADELTAVFDYATPRSLPAGTYTLRVFLTYTCPDFVWSTQQPDTPFRVADGN